MLSKNIDKTFIKLFHRLDTVKVKAMFQIGPMDKFHPDYWGHSCKYSPVEAGVGDKTGWRRGEEIWDAFKLYF